MHEIDRCIQCKRKNEIIIRAMPIYSHLDCKNNKSMFVWSFHSSLILSMYFYHFSSIFIFFNFLMMYALLSLLFTSFFCYFAILLCYFVANLHSFVIWKHNRAIICTCECISAVHFECSICLPVVFAGLFFTYIIRLQLKEWKHTKSTDWMKELKIEEKWVKKMCIRIDSAWFSALLLNMFKRYFASFDAFFFIFSIHFIFLFLYNIVEWKPKQELIIYANVFNYGFVNVSYCDTIK